MYSLSFLLYLQKYYFGLNLEIFYWNLLNISGEPILLINSYLDITEEFTSTNSLFLFFKGYFISFFFAYFLFQTITLCIITFISSFLILSIYFYDFIFFFGDLLKFGTSYFLVKVLIFTTFFYKIFCTKNYFLNLNSYLFKYYK